MKISIITAFPNSFSFLSESIPKRAVEKGLLEIEILDLRKYGIGKWKKIDDKPYAGGAGMLMQIEPIYNTLKSLGVYPKRDSKTKIILTSARGKEWNQNLATSYSSEIEHLVIICGHYEGIDHRVAENLIDEEISIGKYILSGGELAAQVISDSIIRLLPGVVGNTESIIEETQFSSEGKVIEHPQYTRPEVFKTDEGEEWSVPEILLSGNHGEVEKWKEEKRLKIKD